MPFRGVEKYDAHRAGYFNFPRLTAGGMRGISSGLVLDLLHHKRCCRHFFILIRKTSITT